MSQPFQAVDQVPDIGMFRMKDETGGEDNVLCVPASDHRRGHIRNLPDVREQE
jgi:inorganic pyrophosphatase